MANQPTDMLDAGSAEHLYEHAPCGLLVATLNGTILRANQTLLGWLGYTANDVVGHVRFSHLLTQPGRVFHETHCAPLLHMQGFIDEVACSLRCADGRTLPVLISSVVKDSVCGTQKVVHTSVFQARDRRKYERELLLERRRAEQAAKARADFLSMVGHEVRNPLHVIISVGDLLAKACGRDEREKYLQMLQVSTTNLLNLVNDVLDFSKVEAGKTALNELRIDLRDIVHSLSALEMQAAAKGIRLEFDLDPTLPKHVIVDPIKLTQILMNLLSNALKFTSRGKVTLTVRTKELGQDTVRVEFSVKDTGIGIPRDKLSAIFEEFTQASLDVARTYGGTGLGLAICRRLVELYGSTIQVESVLGQGSRFWFELCLRLAEPPLARARLTEKVVATPTLDDLQVLALSGDEANQRELQALLERAGAKLELVDTSRHALERVRNEDYDVVLVDLDLPASEAQQVARELRAFDQPNENLPILAMVTSSQAGQSERLRRAGFSDTLTKPFEPEAARRSLAFHGYMQRARRRSRSVT